MIKKSALFFLFLWTCTCGNSFAATTYVDNQLTSNCDGSSYYYDPTAGRGDTCRKPGSGAKGYIKIQDAIINMSVGDTILIRGGTYQENNTGSGLGYAANVDIVIPPSKNGSAWTEGNYNTLASYPGEWAILDAEGATAMRAVLGYLGLKTPGEELKYWKFERLEIKGMGVSGTLERSGLFLSGGPFIIRYCHFNSNFSDNTHGNPSGLRITRAHDCTIEFNYFYHNGGTGAPIPRNSQQLLLMSDYCDELDQTGCSYYACGSFQNDLCDEDNCTEGNIIRYNLFDGGAGETNQPNTGIKYKPSQILDPTDGSSTEHKTWGDQVHHNIFKDHDGAGLLAWQDYIQVHHNIFDGDFMEINMGGEPGDRLRQCIYNNTLLTTRIESGCDWGDTFNPWDFIYNNILDNSPGGSNSTDRPLTIWGRANVERCGDIDTSHFDMDKNYLYRPQFDSNQVVMSMMTGCGSEYGYMTLSEFNTDYNKNNYTKASSEGSDNLMKGSSGADKYKTRGSHVVSGSTTLSNSGKGGSHPYLSGVTLPLYLGATNPSGSDSGLNWDPFKDDPDDSGWVDYVLSLSDINNLKSGGYIGIPPLPPKSLR